MSAVHPTPATVDAWKRAQRYARYIWQRSTAARRKLLRDAGLSTAQGLRELHGRLLVPMRDQLGELWAVQEMPTAFRGVPCSDSGPTFLLGARLDGMRYIVGALPGSDAGSPVIGVTVSVHDAMCWNGETGAPVLVAFALENVAALAAELRHAYPAARVVLWARWEEHAEGIRSAAKRAGACAVFHDGFDLPEAMP